MDKKGNKHHELKIILLILLGSLMKANTAVHLYLLESELWRLIKFERTNTISNRLSVDRNENMQES